MEFCRSLFCARLSCRRIPLKTLPNFDFQPVKVLIRHTDEELLGLLRSGDKAAFEEIYRVHAPVLYNYARRNVASKEDCEEIIQEIFESIWARRKGLEIISFRFYLIQMVKYKLVRYFQRRTLKRRLIEHFGIFETMYDHMDVTSIDQEVIEKAIEKKVGQLPARCQAAFRLRIYERLSNGDIAERMNISRRTVEGYMHVALSHMRGHSTGRPRTQ